MSLLPFSVTTFVQQDPTNIVPFCVPTTRQPSLSSRLRTVGILEITLLKEEDDEKFPPHPSELSEGEVKCEKRCLLKYLNVSHRIREEIITTLSYYDSFANTHPRSMPEMS